MNEVIERCNWLVNKCEDKAITPDVKDDVRYLLEEIERLYSIIKEISEYIEEKEKDDDNWIDYELLIEPIRIKEILDKGSDKE